MQKNSSLVIKHILWRGLYFFSILLLNIGIARFFAAEQSGQIFYIVNNLSLILLLVSGSLESGAAYYLASGQVQRSAVARFCLIWSALAALPAFGIWWGIVHLSNEGYTATGILTAGFLFIPGVLLTTYFTALFYAGKQFVFPNQVLFFSNVLLIALLMSGRNFPVITSHFLELYFGVFFVQGLILMSAYFIRDLPPEDGFMPSAPLLKKIFRYSFTALLANLIYFLINRVDYWFVDYYGSKKDLGNYIQASKLGQMLLILPSILAASLFPIFSSQQKADGTRSNPELGSIIRILLGINIAVCILILASGWYIFPMLFGHSFDSMYLLFVLLIPGILSFTMNYPLAAWFSSSKRIDINIRGSFLTLLIILIGDWFFIPRYGAPAAALVSSVGYFFYFAYSFYRYRKMHIVPLRDFLMIRKSDIGELREAIRHSFRPEGKDMPSPSNVSI